MNRQTRDISKMIHKSQAGAGTHFISGSTTVTGDFYGLTVVNAPTSINMTLTDEYLLNGSVVGDSDELVDFIPTNMYLPLNFSSITIDSGNVIL